jgi:hypothetical protein
MEQLSLPHVTHSVDFESMVGTTAWKNAATDPPPVAGWWKCRTTLRRGTVEVSRRFWDGCRFGPPVYPDDEDETVAECMRVCSITHPSRIEWCGLKAPHPAPYPYRLYATGTGLHPINHRSNCHAG